MSTLVVSALFAASFAPRVGGAQVSLESSNLPIMIIDTDGVAIRDEPKIMATMYAIDNGPGTRNSVTDPPSAYDGLVGIEFRGSSSLALFPKKSYALETRNADESNRNVALLGLPTENDWVLHGPYSDKSLIRNVVAFHVARSTGRYASSWRFIELVINGNYEGIYVMLERVKRDNDRIDITPMEPTDASGDALTGGYILKIDKTDGAEVGGWYSSYASLTDDTRFPLYQYHYPRPSEINSEQEAYIQEVVSRFEDVMASDDFGNPDVGYTSLLDVDALIDYMLVTEVTNNVDGYRLSTFFYKDRDSVDGRLVMGPPWDYNIAFGNANYFDGGSTSGFRLLFEVPPTDPFHAPFWWVRFVDDPGFVSSLNARWRELRVGPLATDSVMSFVDSMADLLTESYPRNFERWPVLDEWIWPNVVVEGSFSGEVAYLKSWLSNRLAWLDDNLPLIAGSSVGSPEPYDGSDFLIRVYPNPTPHQFTATISIPDRGGRVRVQMFDVAGREIAILLDRFATESVRQNIQSDTRDLPAGTYFVRVAGASGSAVAPLTIVR
ncbi:MAG: CotH kinase family protein [Rhodothermia bacterium]|nr:CotH kinase family protein [Rhodothermia bacterium]